MTIFDIFLCTIWHIFWKHEKKLRWSLCQDRVFPKCSKFWLAFGCWMTPIKCVFSQKNEFSKIFKIMARIWVLDDANKWRFFGKNVFLICKKVKNGFSVLDYSHFFCFNSFSLQSGKILTKFLSKISKTRLMGSSSIFTQKIA